MLSHKRKDTLEKVKMFKASAPPKILVSPSMTTGWDFPGSECEYQIIGKLAYPDTRSKLVKARMDADDDYAPYVAMQQLIQACGRGVRSLTDRCENFIIDDNIVWFIRRYRKFAPKWFSEAFISRVTAPEPPAKLEREEETVTNEEHLWEVERNA
jgi:Rad3-related DNA helicase